MSLLKSHLEQSITWSLDSGEEAPAQFSDIAKELHELNNNAALIDFSHHDQVEISGDERVSFLQGLTTNQIKDITADKCVYSTMLTPQGRFLWDYTICETGDTLTLMTEPGQGSHLVKSLNFYLMRTKAVVKDVSSEYGVLAIVGPKATKIVSELFLDCATKDAPLGATFTTSDNFLLWRDPRHEDFGWRLLAESEKYPQLWKKISEKISPAGYSAWESYRIQKGLPRGGKELIPNKTLPLEASLFDLNGVNFQKGCFVGQETTARTHHRGTLKKRVFQVTLETENTIIDGTPVLTSSQKEAGIVTSASLHNGYCHALAMLRVSDVAKGDELSILGHKVSVHKPIWASWELT
ncbi:MAG: folate-binding protein YgfZ [Magnetococcales bacterium]|nr:folate-binding protein YgfZ [Magnetococcales bacterium]